MWSLKVIHTDKATLSDHGMIVACMAVLHNSGMTKEQAIPIYQKLLDHHGLTAEAVNANMFRALSHLPGEDLARGHLLEVCPELGGEL